MYTVGEVSIKFKNLIDATYDSMMKAINILKPGLSLGDIGYEIQSHVEMKENLRFTLVFPVVYLLSQKSSQSIKQNNVF